MNKLEFAKENPPHGEDEAVQKLIALLKQRLDREYPSPQRTLRDAHSKQHGLVRAHFVVEKNLPDDLRIGVFKEPRTFPAWVRFSNASDPPADIKKDSRGMAIKLMEVDGKKILDETMHDTTQDFVLMSTQFFITKGVAEFAALVDAVEGGFVRLIVHFVTHPRLLILFLKARQRCASPLEISYGSTTPYLLGTRAVKYAIRPAMPGVARIPATPSADYLREAMVNHLSEREACFDFLVQVQTDAKRMPIEDPRVVWSESLSPFVKVATIRIPPQKFDTPAQHEYGDNLSFNPWHCLPEHRPLGGINRARKIIYETMSKYRHARNSAPRDEPTGWVLF
jgi:hypothetical protein